ncbi:putative callose synthase 8 [Phragmites australis]|uniref:putative callose synthase 8 n=1 Tax=Phragmites australis TaxID=29695 RepID=UPI002D7699E7|nr:putative callose synthase 8 [Phragmites australis]
MELEIVEVGPSSRPLRYVPRPLPWRQPPPPPPPPPTPQQQQGAAAAPVAQQFDSEKLPQTLVSEIRPFLRAANQVEAENPRVAYLCRFHAFEKAHKMDPRSTGRGVRQFKTALLQRLEQDERSTKSKMTQNGDAREMKSFYEQKKQANAHELLPVLAEVLKALLTGTGLESLAATEDFADMSDLFRYNILPLHPRSSQKPIMLLPEIKVAVAAVFNVRSLPSANIKDEKAHRDILRWLQSWFGFQKGNVANQREHLILLLANVHARFNPKPSSAPMLDDRAVDELLAKTFENYLTWCKFLGRKSNIWLPSVKQEIQQHKLLYIALYLLIWGEASNLRLMPECLCYIFHHMSYELYGVLSGAVSLITGEKVRPAYGGDDESFLNNVVRPIYIVILEEAQKNKNGASDHSTWRNYDDINEFFWSADCFKLGWPMRLNNDFFFTSSATKNSQVLCRSRLSRVPHGFENCASCVPLVSGDISQQTEQQNPQVLHESSPAENNLNSEGTEQRQQQSTSQTSQQRWLGKTNFVEVRSFWHLFRSFDRMWTVLVLGLQVLIIMAWHGLESPLQLLDPIIFEDVLSIFITNAVLRVIQVILDIAFSWRTKPTMRFDQILRFTVKFSLSVAWAIILPTFYASSKNYKTCSAQRYKTFLGMFCLSNYMVAVALYLVSNVIGMALFFVPAVTSYIETSTWRICNMLSWWCQPQSYVGRGMQEGQVPLLKYTAFWMVLLSSKFLFSYYFEVKPLVGPTKEIMKINVNKYEWHEFFPQVKSNAGAILAVWAPIILVYFMDTQIWYSVFCTIFGGMCGIIHHLGEIRTMGMVRSRFCTLPEAFNMSLVPHSMPKEKKGMLPSFLEKKIFKKLGKAEIHDPTKFALVWNQIINSFHSEDLISNREMDLMMMPMSLQYSSGSIRWPLFLLAKKFSEAVDMAANFTGKSAQLFWKIKKDNYMFCAINDFYELTKNIFIILVIGEPEKRLIAAIFDEIEKSIQNSSLLINFRMDHLPSLLNKFDRLAELLYINKQELRYEVTILLQDIVDILIQDMIVDAQSILDVINSSERLISNDDGTFGYYEPELFASVSSISNIQFPFSDNDPVKEQVKRLSLLLNTKDKVVEIPSNLEAQRRISFFATSLFMDMPAAPKVRSMLSFSIITPYFMEEVKFSEDELHSNQDEASVLSYMQKIYPDEWKNFLERLGPKVTNDEIRYWASFRGQTLSRTVRGMMYYRKALRLQAFLDRTNDQELDKGPMAAQQGQNKRNIHQSLSTELDALADMKFSYVISCQKFGEQKIKGDPLAQDIIDLMTRYPALRVAYIEEKEVIVNNFPHQVYSSVLIKAENNFDQEIYRIKLPGPPIIGEGKPENQNHAIIFTRGEALQTIDMNQDNYLEEAYKMRNVLQEFVRHPRDKAPTILGLREHIFTGSVSSLAGFMSYQETSFVTIGQRFLADPLRVRFHYGHPDIFDRIFHLTRGGISKASKTINLSEDVFAGYNSILRRGHITYNEYIQVGKGRDVGLNQISKFEAKVANGNSEQTLSRDIYRLGRRFDFFRMLSCYFTTVGFYFNSLISIVGLYVFLYGQLYLVLSGLQMSLLLEAQTQNIKSLETALASQSFLQLGLLTGLPMVMELGLEKGFLAALSDFILMQLQLASVFFTFSLGTKAHYYGRTILHGGAKYRPTGRKFVVFHASFTENYQLYSRSHFVKGFELIFLLIVYHIFRRSYASSVVHVMITYSTWFMAVTWLFAPFLFNPAGFAWQKIVEDWADWNRWMRNQGGIGVQPEKSWESWWNAENAHLRHSVLSSRVLEVLLSLRFFIYQYGLVYHLNISQDNKNFLVYLLSWVVIIAIIGLVKLVNCASRRLSSKHQLIFRLIKLLIFLAVVTSIILLYSLCQLSIMDLIVCCLAFIPTGWGLLLIIQVLRPKIEYYAIWEPIQVIAHAYDYGMGSLLFFPIAVLAWMPVISAIQTRVLFNRAFSQQLQIQPFIVGKTKRR